MQSIETHGLDDLERAIDRAIREAPNKRRELHEQLATLVKTEVDKNIAGSVNDSHGKVQGWQEKHVGTGGGYAAVRPTDSSSGPDSPGAITNYLTSGHRIRKASGRAKRPRRSRARMAYVDGRHFYQKTAAEIEAPAIQMAARFVDNLSKTLGG